MEDQIVRLPKDYNNILNYTKTTGFNQLSDLKVGSFLAALCGSKPNGKFLELGTGSGLSTSWMLMGMCSNSSLISVDNDESLVSIARKYLKTDKRVEFIVGQGEDVIDEIGKDSIDFIFADTWPGKYHYLEEALSLLKVGGFYIVDDMLPQENWPDGHGEKADHLAQYLMNREDLLTTRMQWSTGVIFCTKLC
jgi:predicted O-methyltransferase YrrM